MVQPNPVDVWLALTIALIVSAVLAIPLTVRTLRWVHLDTKLNEYERKEKGVLSLGHLLRECIRLIAAFFALGAASVAWEVRHTVEWTPLVGMLVLLLGSLLINSLIDHIVRRRVLHLVRHRLGAASE